MHLKVVLHRLDEIEQELQELRAKVERTRIAKDQDETELFLRKCGGWQDDRSPEEIISAIYASRSSSLRGTELSHGPQTPED